MESELEKYQDWVLGADRNPYDEIDNPTEEERAKDLAYYLSVDNWIDGIKVVDEFMREKMEEDPRGNIVHDTAMIAARENWRDYLP